MTVTGVTDLHPRLRRLTFAAPEFGRFAPGAGRVLRVAAAERRSHPPALVHDPRAPPRGGRDRRRRGAARRRRPGVAVRGAGRGGRHATSAAAAPRTRRRPGAAQLLLADETVDARAGARSSSRLPAARRRARGGRAARRLVDVRGRRRVRGRVAPPRRAAARQLPDRGGRRASPYPLDYAWVCGEAGGVKCRATPADRPLGPRPAADHVLRLLAGRLTRPTNVETLRRS